MKFYKILLITTFCLSACNPLYPELTTTPIPTSTSTSTPTKTPTPTPTIVPTPTQMGGGSGKVIFGYTKEGFKDDYPDLQGKFNIFISNLDGTDLVALTDGISEGDNYVEAISPDGSKVLISAFTYARKKESNAILYLFDLNNIDSEPVHLVSHFSNNSRFPAAEWINNSEFVYLGNGEEGYGFYVKNIDSFETIKLKPYTENPEAILGVNEERVYWYTRVKRDYGVSSGDYQAVWWTSIDGSDQGKLETNGVPVEYYSGGIGFSPDGKTVAWIPSVPEPECDTVEKINALYASASDDYHYEYASTCRLLYMADLSDMDHPIKIPLIPQRDNIPNNFEYRPSTYKLKWSSNSFESFVLNPGTYSPAFMYSIDFSQTKPEFVWHENFPSVRDDNGAWFPSIIGFSPDGRQMLVKKIIVGKTSDVILINLESMTTEEGILYDLNRDEVYHVHLLPKSGE
jgi:hypothetical protein